jgi:hypothetical protein
MLSGTANASDGRANHLRFWCELVCTEEKLFLLFLFLFPDVAIGFAACNEIQPADHFIDCMCGSV